MILVLEELGLSKAKEEDVGKPKPYYDYIEKEAGVYVVVELLLTGKGIAAGASEGLDHQEEFYGDELDNQQVDEGEEILETPFHRVLVGVFDHDHEPHYLVEEFVLEYVADSEVYCVGAQVREGEVESLHEVEGAVDFKQEHPAAVEDCPEGHPQNS